MNRTTGAQAILHLLAEAGVTRLFGNPGTTELPLVDAVAAEPRIEYVLGLQEVPVMAMADGFAMASGGLGVVNLHASCGLGNAMGMLYNALAKELRSWSPQVRATGESCSKSRFWRATWSP
ncbi:MAG: thiamine pyrophosphate-binding protein [Pirellulales bacterium]